MKIGIITIQNAINYGSTLQAYALQEILKEMGHDVYIVDWQNKRLNSVYRIDYELRKKICHIFKGHIRSGLQEFNETMKAMVDNPYLSMLSKYDAYCKKHLCLTKSISNYESDMFQQFDALICGSDQVWNVEITGGQLIYALALPNFKGKKIAYAASGNLEQCVDLVDCIKKINFLSVRENKLQEQLQMYGVSNVHKVCDPTFLPELEFWKKQLKQRVVKPKYIFAYLMWDEPIVLSYIEQLANEKKLPVIILHRAKKYVSLGRKKVRTTTPGDFLNLIANAEYVIANSFHGTVFSILFHKQFVSYGSGERVFNLLSDLKLTDRMILREDNSWNEIDNNIDWCIVEKILSKEREAGKEFLRQSLEEKL